MMSKGGGKVYKSNSHSDYLWHAEIGMPVFSNITTKFLFPCPTDQAFPTSDMSSLAINFSTVRLLKMVQFHLVSFPS